ncbi:amidase [Xanthobacteraceae bacterium Astr-EGSB]|uniref:amidase n=1 Tax=Astrobacterium formosum TaxID=3069710 RepID=UPI0027B45E7F|nr:amidase [Xanthobacteraceae bacterium Astr-EGSB]
MRDLAATVARLEAGESSRALVKACLERIHDPAGEGARVFLKTYDEEAFAAAETADRLRNASAAPSRFAGIPISVKDLFDIAGDTTTAGSVALKNAPPAKRDAVAVARLKAAGFIPLGRTNMTEFAFSGLGLNPHYDTPLNPYDRKTGRIPGGSSSGAAVSVADGMAYAALGTDTGGSCRIPAALCGIVGFKPTARRVPKEGVLPLSQTLDSIGPLGRTVACCAALDAILAGEEPDDLAEFPLEGLRLAAPQTVVLDGLDNHVERSFAAALSQLAARGVKIVELPVREFSEAVAANHKGGFVTAEAYAVHRPLIKVMEDKYDPRVLARILRGREMDAADYIELMWAREDLVRRLDAVTAPFDAMVMPTVPLVAPPVHDLAANDAYRTANTMMLRNPGLANFFDRCAITIPCHKAGAPVGLMLMGETGGDRRLLAIAAAVERVVAPKE